MLRRSMISVAMNQKNFQRSVGTFGGWSFTMRTYGTQKSFIIFILPILRPYGTY
jgi:hypothetical protein